MNLQQFYGVHARSGRLVPLPKAQWSSAALLTYQTQCWRDGDHPEEFDLILTEDEYRVIRSHVQNELDDQDGDGQVPTFFTIQYETHLPVFPHPSVKSEEDMVAFVEGHSIPLTHGIRLATVRDQWPALDESEPAA